MLPFCDRTVSVERKDVAPVWTRSFPIAKEPTSVGQHLKKKRFMDGLRQKQIAAKLGVSARTLSQWECDRIVPAWEYQPRLVAYLGFDPFIGLTPGKPKGNETSGVAFLSPEAPTTIGQRIREFRLESRKTWKQLTEEWGVSAKTLRGWASNRTEPSPQTKKRLPSSVFGQI